MQYLRAQIWMDFVIFSYPLLSRIDESQIKNNHFRSTFLNLPIFSETFQNLNKLE